MSTPNFFKDTEASTPNFFKDTESTQSNFFKDKEAETIQESITQPIEKKEPFWKKFGQALSYQAQSLPPPETLPQLAAGTAEKLTFGLVNLKKAKSDPEKAIRFMGKEVIGNSILYSKVGSLVKDLPFVSRLFGWMSFGGVESGLKQYFDKRDIDIKEVSKDMLIFGATELGAELVNAAVNTKQAINYLSESSGKPKREVEKFLWENFKENWKSKFKTAPTKETLLQSFNESKQVWEETIVKAAEDIKTSPVKETPKAKAVVPEEIKPVVKPKVEISKPKGTIYVSEEKVEPLITKYQKEEEKLLTKYISKEIYEKEYKNRSFAKQQEFWKKYKKEFSNLNKVDENAIDKLHVIDSLKDWKRDILEFKSAFYGNEGRENKLNGVITEIRNSLISHDTPKEINLVKEAFKFLQQEKYTPEEIKKSVVNVLKRDLSSGDMKFVLEQFNKQVEPIKPIKPTKPIKAYHGTQTEFKEFGDTKELGFHFSSSEDTAMEFAKEAEQKGKAGRILETSLNIKNPLKMKDQGGWTPLKVATEIDKMGITKYKQTEKDFGELGQKVYDATRGIKDVLKADEIGQKTVANYLKDKGYDAIEYINEFEGKKVPSYIVLDKKNIKITSEKNIPATETKKAKVPTKTKIEKPKKAIEPSIKSQLPELQTDFTKTQLEKQKSYLLNKVDELVKTPVKDDIVTIKVPGDGIFKIKNNVRTLEEFKHRVNKLWPSKPLKSGVEKTGPAVKSLKPLKIRTDAAAEKDKLKTKPKPKPKETVVYSLFVPQKYQKYVNAVVDQGKKLGKSQSEIGQMGWKATANWVGPKNYAKWVSAMKWDKLGKDLSKDAKEDMLYYRERTGNPFKKDDTYAALVKRLTQNEKNIVDVDIDKDFTEGLALINSSKYVKPISPREIVRNIFVPHFYEGSDMDKKIMEAYRKLGKKFNTKNPFENRRLFMTFDEAFKEAGLKPRFTNIIDSVKAYDAIVSRILSNNELIGTIKEFEKKNDIKVILRKTGKTAEKYANALNEGWIPFYDPFLRTVFDGTSWKVSDAPALIHPDLAESMQGIFQKKPTDFAPSIFKTVGAYYDATSSALRNIAVNFSGFHFVALAESFVGATKWTDLLHLPTLWKNAGAYLTDPKIMEPALKAGLKIDFGAEQTQQFMEKNLNKINDWLRTKNWKLNPSKAYEKAFLDPYIRYQNFLWKTFHPRLKINTFYQYRQDFLNEVAKKGEIITPDEFKNVEAQIAEQVNNIFGGQVWELQKYFNDPEVRKWMYRLVGYPDWSLSAIKQAGEGVRILPSLGKKGQETKDKFRAKKGLWYWAKYVVALITFQNVINYITTGHSTFENDDPKHRLDFKLPEIKVKIKGKEYNLGRDEKGRQYYSHTGKQMLEIEHYFTSLLSQLFNKSNPLFQLLAKQIIGYTPYKGGGFPVQGKFKRGKMLPWDAQEGFLKQLPSRTKEAAQTLLPFSIRGAIQHPGASLLTLGSLPVTKGLSLYDAKEYLEKEYIKDKPDIKEIRKIHKALRDGGYKAKQILRVDRTTRTQVRNDKRAKKK